MQSGALVMESTEYDSSQLLTRARDGDLQSFDQIMILHQRRVLHTALRILGNLQDAQDATQEVFLRLYKYLDRFDTSRSLSPWLYRLTVNVCHDITKKRPQTSELPETLTANSSDHSADIQIMTQALATLPEKERSALVLRDIEGLSTKEVAEILGSTETTVRSQISRARIKLKEFRNRVLRRQL
jgi:RNA polymerase sigma-70 factor (ECF subfamily)